MSGIDLTSDKAVADFTAALGAFMVKPPLLLAPPKEPEVQTAPGHTRIVFDHKTFPRVVDWVISVARPRRFEALAACGHSGLLVAGAAAYVLNVPVIAVRKADESAHDCRQLNAILPRAAVRYAFVDDLIASGDTFIRVVQRVHTCVSEEAVCTGILLYNSLNSVDTESILTAVGARWRNDRHILQAARAPVFERPRTKNSDYGD